MPRNPKCTDCALHRSTTHRCVWGDGPNDADVVIVGEAPGEAEARTGKPFMGKSGQLLRDRLARSGLNSVYITNVAKCRPPANRAPTPDEIKACRKYLDEEIATVKPRAILALGAVASKAVLRQAKITENHGRITEKDGLITCAIYHPAYALRDPSKLPAFEADLARFARYLKGEKRAATVNSAVVQRENLDQFIDDLNQCTEFSFDLETSSLNWFDPNQTIRSLQLGLAFEDGSDFGWVIPMNIRGSPFHNDRLREEIMMIIFDALAGKDACAHNGKFDNHWLWIKFKRRFRLTFDTMLASHTLDENRDHDLKGLVRAFLDEPDYDIPLREKRNPTDLPKYYRYGVYDSVYTLRLKLRVFQPQFRRDVVLRRLFYGLIMPAARAFEEIDGNGLYVDLEKMKTTEEDVHRQLEEILAQLNKMAGRPINWNAPAQVAGLLYGDLKLACSVFTDKGAQSTNEEALLSIKGKHPVADLLVKYRELEKFRSTYLDGWKEFMVGPMLYLSTKLHGTVTGRYSSRLHQVPRDGTIRSLIDAPEGWVFVQADLSQAELRIAAILSRDPELTSCYRRGIDVHWRTLMSVIAAGAAAEYVEQAIKTAMVIRSSRRKPGLTEALEIIFEAGHDKCISIWKGWKEARKRAKAVNFGFLYGMREPKFIETCKLKYGFEPTMNEAERSRNAFFHLYNRLTDWHKKQIRLVHLSSYVRNLSGRMRRLPGIASSDRSISSEAERQAINSPVQGYIGDHKAMAVVEIHETFDRDTELRVVGEVHDSILMWVRPSKIDSLLPRVADIMRRPRFVREMKINLPVPLESEFEVGPWGDGETWRPK